MLPDRVSNPGPLTYESGALPTALRGQAHAGINCAHASMGCCLQNSLIFIRFAKNISREFVFFFYIIITAILSTM